MMRAAAIIAASGQGQRMGAALKKQYMLLQGMPVLSHSVRVFLNHPDVGQVVVVVPPGEVIYVRKTLRPYLALDRLTFAEGGKRRQDSVFNGLKLVNREAKLVCIHDGARPLVTKEMIDAVIEAALKWGAAIPVLPLTDTLKEITAEGFIKNTIPRESVRRSQTPQVFRQDIIREAYHKAELLGIETTDDAYLLEILGYSVVTVPGEPENIKITCPSDLQVASALLKEER